MNALYNEIEPYTADWLENLIARGHIAPGRVERRSIAELKPDDVAGPGQRHFFAGIGGWSYALRLAGVPDDADIWTGSCPCQPFSDAGKGLGVLDPRHLWPAWFALIEKCRPAVIFGEQVASRDGLAWLDLVYADLERCGYAVGAADLCAAGIGAPHLRQRLYWVAMGNSCRARGGGHAGAISDAQTQGKSERRESRRIDHEPIDASEVDSMANANGVSRRLHESKRQSRGALPETWGGSETRTMANTDECRWQGRTSDGGWQAWGDASRNHEGLEWLECKDGRRRPTKPGIQPLAHGLPKGVVVGSLAGAGNAIVPQVAAAFIQAALPTPQLAGNKK